MFRDSGHEQGVARRRVEGACCPSVGCVRADFVAQDVGGISRMWLMDSCIVIVRRSTDRIFWRGRGESAEATVFASGRLVGAGVPRARAARVLKMWLPQRFSREYTKHGLEMGVLQVGSS